MCGDDRFGGLEVRKVWKFERLRAVRDDDRFGCLEVWKFTRCV